MIIETNNNNVNTNSSNSNNSNCETTYQNYARKYCLRYVTNIFNIQIDDKWFRYIIRHWKNIVIFRL